MRMNSLMALALTSALAMVAAAPRPVVSRPTNGRRRKAAASKPQHPLGSKLQRRLKRKHELGRSGSF